MQKVDGTNGPILRFTILLHSAYFKGNRSAYVEKTRVFKVQLRCRAADFLSKPLVQ